MKQVGTTHLLLIAINNYRDQPPLQAATNGADELQRVLIDRYGVSKENIHPLREAQATALEIMNTLKSFRPEKNRKRKLTKDDTLIVYFAGHGEHDEAANHTHICAYEIPDASNIISFDDIRAQFRAIEARHILFICDSCFSGGIFRSSRTNTYNGLCYETKSREALTSGNLEIVGDISKGGQTAFNSYLTRALWKNENPTLLTSELHAAYRKNVTDNTDTSQHPLHSEIPNSGHEQGGELVFFLAEEHQTIQADAFLDLLHDRLIENFDTLITERTRKFIGRDFLTSEVLSCVGKLESGIVFVSADPGFGKTSWAAQICKNHEFPRHFIDGSHHNSSPDFIKENLARQVLSNSTLKNDQVNEIDWDQGLWSGMCSLITKFGLEKSVLVIDGIDELSDQTKSDHSSSHLYLFDAPLPPGLVVVAVGRRDENVALPVGSKKIEVTSSTDDNYEDVRCFFEREIPFGLVKKFLVANSVTMSNLINHLTENSQGNFMYAELIVPHFLGASDSYSYSRLDEIPEGLERYYEEHWRYMKVIYGDKWFQTKLPVLVELTLSEVPISVDQIMRNTDLTDRHAVRVVLSEWSAFLHKTPKTLNDYGVAQYNIYHKTFREFISALDTVEDERIQLNERKHQRALKGFEQVLAGLENESK